MRRFLERTLGAVSSSSSQKGTQVAPASVVLPSSAHTDTETETDRESVRNPRMEVGSYISEPEEESDPDYLMVERPGCDDLTHTTTNTEEVTHPRPATNNLLVT